jgi:outer membrane cobalamin receptor
MISFERRIGRGPKPKTVVESYYRTHGDRFLYDIRTPDLYENRHRTHALGVQAKSRWDLSSRLSFSLGGETGGDWIASNNLGDHAFARMSAYGEIQWKPGLSAGVYSGLRFDYYSNFGPTASPSLSGSWWLGRRLRLRSSVARAFRIPTFTELYYRDPSRQADPRLKPETAWSFEGGADFVPKSGWMGSMTAFERRESNVIDWIRRSAAEKWRSSNIRSIEAGGIELGLQRSLLSEASFAMHYTYLRNDAGRVDFISQYALDFARHSWGASVLTPLPFSFTFNQTANYRRRADGRSYWLLDARLSKRFGFLSADLDITNMLNSRYQEVLGVNMPGRWITLSLRAIAAPH